jgi:hypothetical protein
VYRFTGPTNERQRAVVAAMKHAWTAYEKYAWGADCLKPVSKTRYEWFNLALTITDSMDTLFIMGMHDGLMFNYFLKLFLCIICRIFESV